MRVYFVHDTDYPWRGKFIFDVGEVKPGEWGFFPSPALVTVLEQGVKEKEGYYFLKGEVYQHFDAKSALLLVTLRQWNNRAKDVVEERAGVIFGEGVLEDIPGALHRIRPETLTKLVNTDTTRSESGIRSRIDDGWVITTGSFPVSQGTADTHSWADTSGAAVTHSESVGHSTGRDRGAGFTTTG